MFLALIPLLAQFPSLLNAQAVDENGVTLAEKVEAVELRMLQPGSIDFGVTPCSNNLFKNPDEGEQTAAQWTRIIFHDAITHDITTGLGGLDASIGFEGDREENIGIFVAATIGDFAGHTSIYRSTSDVIAMGLAASMLSCDSTQPLIKLRAGRIDATGPGPTGVPGPFDSLEFATNAFAKAGFNQSEMIQSIACGHSLGAVHRVNFPDIVGPEVITAGTDGNDTFDSTPFNFDNMGVNEYLTGTGRKGGPLVVGANVSARSDFRIFNSDRNVTMQNLNSPNTFRTTCFRVFEKMLDTVPNGVVLSDPIVPRQWILRSGHLDLDNTNTVRYIGAITTHHKTAVAPAKASWFFGTNGGGNTGTQLSDNGFPHNANPTAPLSTAFGPLIDYNFNQSLGHSPLDVTTFNIALASAPTTSVYSKALTPSIFILASKSFTNFAPDSTGLFVNTLFIRAAVRTTLASGTFTATLYYPRAQEGSLAPKFVRKIINLTKGAVRGAYTVYEGVVATDLPTSQGETHVDVQKGAVKSAKIDSFLLTRCSIQPITNC